VYSAAFALYMPSRMAILADFTPVENRTRVYSIMGLAWPLGSIAGPTISGLLQGVYGWNVVFYVASVFYVVCLMPSLLLPKPRAREGGEESQVEKRTNLDLTFVRQLLGFIMLNLFMGLGIGTTNSITPIYLTEKFAVSTEYVGFFVSVGFGLVAILAQIPGGFLADRFGRKRFVAVCSALEPFLFILWTFVNNPLTLLLVQMGINALWSMTWPATMSLLMEHAPGSKRGITSGFTQMGIMFGFTVGPTIGGFLWDTRGMSFPYYASALFFALCLPIMPFIARQKDDKSPHK
jgi:MFS family permease